MRTLCKLSLVGLPIALSGCHQFAPQPRTDAGAGAFAIRFPMVPNPGNTPIVVTGGSVIIQSDTPWVSGASGTWTGTVPAEILRISVVNKDQDGKERAEAEPPTKGAWMVHLLRTKGTEVTIGGSAVAGGLIKAITVTPGDDAAWYVSADKMSLALVTEGSQKIEQVIITVPAGSIKPFCQTDTETGTPRGHCKLHFRTVNHEPDAPPQPTQ